MRESPAPLYLLLLALAPAAQAVDAIVLEVGELRVAGIPVEAASARLDLLEGKQTRVTIRAGAATVARSRWASSATSRSCARRR